MKRFFVLVALLITVSAFAQDVSLYTSDNAQQVYFNDPVPNIPAFSCDFASSTIASLSIVSTPALLSSYVTLQSTVKMVSIKALGGALRFGPSGLTAANSVGTEELASGSIRYFRGTKTLLDAMYIGNGAGTGSVTAALIQYK